MIDIALHFNMDRYSIFIMPIFIYRIFTLPLCILQVLLSQVHRLRALDLLGRFLDLGPWAVSLVSHKGKIFLFWTFLTPDLSIHVIDGYFLTYHMYLIIKQLQALSVGIFPYVLKLLQSSARELRPLLVFIWAKILSVDSVSFCRC